MKYQRNIKMLRGQWEVAPLASVFFLLVLFLLLHSGFVFPPGVRIELPEGSAQAGVAGPAITLAIDADGQAYFEHESLHGPELERRLREVVLRYGEPPTLIVQVDRRASAADFSAYCQIARAAGIRDVVMATRPPPTPNFSPGVNP